MRRFIAALTLILGTAFWSVPRLQAQESPAAPETKPAETAPAEAAAGEEKEPLSATQDLLARRYKRFVETLRKIAENIKKTDPSGPSC